MKTVYSFYSTDGVLRRNFSREQVLDWYYDGKVKPDAAVTRTENGQKSVITLASLEPGDREPVPNTSGLANASLPDKCPRFNVGAMVLSPLWSIVYRQPALGVCLWSCCAAIGYVAWKSTCGSFRDLMLLFRIDAVSHIALWILSVYMGFAGSRAAWRSRRFKSEASFRRCMLVWQAAGVLAFILFAVAFVLFAIAAVRRNILVE